MLRFDREKEARSKVVDGRDARNKGIIASIVGIEIAVLKKGQVPDHSKDQPTEKEGTGEQTEDPGPLKVKDGDENVLWRYFIIIYRVIVTGALSFLTLNRR